MKINESNEMLCALLQMNNVCLNEILNEVFCALTIKTNSTIIACGVIYFLFGVCVSTFHFVGRLVGSNYHNRSACYHK